MLSLQKISIRRKSPLTGRLIVKGKVLHKLPLTLWHRVWSRQRVSEGSLEKDKPLSDFPHCNPPKNLCL